MAQAFRAHYNGTIIVPEEPVDLPVNETFMLVFLPLATTIGVYESLPMAERLGRLEATSGRLSGPVLPSEALRRENLYEERL